MSAAPCHCSAAGTSTLPGGRTARRAPRRWVLTRSVARERGFALASSVVMLTILFLLSAYMVAFRVYQEAGVALDTLATRAHAAARAGAEWGLYNSLRNNACAASTSIALGGSLAGYTATVTCTRSAFNEGGATVNMDTIVANACNQPAAGACPNNAPAANYVERQMTVTVGQ